MTVNFGQLIEYNTRNIFYEKSYTKCGGETSPRRFSKKSKLSLSQDQQLRAMEYILKLKCRDHLVLFTSYKPF